MTMTRRVFMKAGAAAAVALGAVPRFLIRAAFAAPGSGNKKVLVAIFQRGAMESATPGLKGTPDGWLNRHLKATAQPHASPFRAVAMGQRMPRSLMGEAPAIAMGDVTEFDVRGGVAGERARVVLEAMYNGDAGDVLYAAGRETFAAMKMLKAANPAQYQPANGASYPRGPFGMALQHIAQLIKAEIGMEIAFADSGGWDTHASQGAAQGQMADRLTEFS